VFVQVRLGHPKDFLHIVHLFELVSPIGEFVLLFDSDGVGAVAPVLLVGANTLFELGQEPIDKANCV